MVHFKICQFKFKDLIIFSIFFLILSFWVKNVSAQSGGINFISLLSKYGTGDVEVDLNADGMVNCLDFSKMITGGGTVLSQWVDIDHEEMMIHIKDWKEKELAALSLGDLGAQENQTKSLLLNEIEALYASMDADGNGRISYQEFNRQNIKIAPKIYQFRHSLKSSCPKGLYDEKEWHQVCPSSPYQEKEIEESAASTREEPQKVAVFVEAGIYDALYWNSLMPWKGDVLNDAHYEVLLHTCNGCTHQEIKDKLKYYYSFGKLAGVVFIGDLPVVWFDYWTQYYPEWDPKIFPCDFYFMDLDGEWSGGTGTPENPYLYHQGEKTPEIFSGRLTVPEEAREIELLTNYFNKNHKYRTGQTFLPQRALIYIDDNWSSWAEEYSDNIGLVYPQRDLVKDEMTTTALDFKNRLDDNYEFLHLISHSTYQFHIFMLPINSRVECLNQGYEWECIEPQGERCCDSHIFWNEIRDLKPHFFSYVIEGCSNARYTEPNYMTGWYVFQKSDYGLIALGLTDTGFIYKYDIFYEFLRQGNNFGSALKNYLNEGDHFELSQWPSPYLLVLIGDPTLKPKMGAESPSNNSPKGFFDSISQGAFCGWACDPDDYSQKLTIRFYQDGDKNDGLFIGETVANLQAEEAVCSQCGGHCHHRFKFPIPDDTKDGQPHDIYAYAVDYPKGIERKLEGNPKSTASIYFCQEDSVCVPAQCCHPNACIHQSQSSDCSGVMCSMECVPETMDCGAGRCVCDHGICQVQWRPYH